MRHLNSIFLIDDDADDNFFHQRTIKRMGIAENIYVAMDAVEALEFLTKGRREAPDLIFLDLNMPKMSGWEFLQEYRKLPPDRRAKKLFILSTSNFYEDIKRSEGIPEVEGYLVKPLSEEMLNIIVNQHFK